MSTRGINFLDRWMAEHLPNAMTDDPAAISDLVGQMLRAAKREGIDRDEINEEVDSVFEVIFYAMQHREGSRAEGDESDKTAEVALDLLAGRLVRETGITHEQAEELIKQIGSDWDALLREAYFLE
ncbi:hypothetical protein RFN29_13365 [Mesorhizobium sp. VK22B]|uniref:DUF768 domain-containing protein n=1 Tax=Mesorhizobium captivum TaxID=3072319 RepID=A0ABU4Z032_9HYPH|nr:hypothetical protein [Mesorhizobium sp. VK22B]MDX8492565.1 hypothetical protein [Mesorhizobium sp. VK22B]